MTRTTTQNRVMFGSGGSLATQEVDFDHVRCSTEGELPPGEGDGGGAVTVVCSGSSGGDRGVLTACAVPFGQYSQTLNKVRFSLRDMAGNLGRGPIYNVRIAKPFIPDFDGDEDIDQADFGFMRSCLSGEGTPTPPGCELADLNADGQITQSDVTEFLGCMAGPNEPPGC